jgi:SAM-dependent methyltransferase
LVSRRARSGGRALLDVACGTGGHLAYLRAWFDVRGVDFTPAMLAIARRKLPGVPLEQGDMATFDLGRRFDAVVCLFSSIAYTGTVERLGVTVRNLARHLAPGGVLVVEPWLAPEVYVPGHLFAQLVDEPERKIARMSVSELQARTAVLRMHHLVVTGAGAEYFEERHELALFRREEYEEAFRAAGLEVEFDPIGLIGRGLFVGLAPGSDQPLPASGSGETS